MVDQSDCLDCKRRRDVGVVDGEEVVSIGAFATRRQVRRPAIDHSVRSVETTDDEFVVDLMPNSNVRHLAEWGRKYRVCRLARDEHALLTLGHAFAVSEIP